MMTFYLGKEYELYDKRFKTIKKHFLNKVGSGTNSAIFRHIVDILYDEISNLKDNNNKVEKKNG